MKITIKNILKENVNDREEEAYQKFLKDVAKRIKPPYIKNMVAYGVPELDWLRIVTGKLLVCFFFSIVYIFF